MSHPRDDEAGEYVLGTLTPEERAAFERDLGASLELRALVADWQHRLHPIGGAIAPVDPPAAVWPAIAQRLSIAGAAERGSADVVSLEALRASRRRWRGAAVTLAAMAASLVAFIAVERWLDVARPGERLVAVVNRGGDLPALIVKVNARSGTILVRPLQVERPSDRSLELWYIAPGQAPLSLGIVDDPARVTSIAYQAGMRPDSTLAVTLEPSGGSPHRSPTGPVVYSGRLLPDPD